MAKQQREDEAEDLRRREREVALAKQQQELKRRKLEREVLQAKQQREEEQRQREKEEKRRKDKEHKLTMANNYEVALRYNDAIEIYEKYDRWEDAGRCRRLQQGKPIETPMEY